MEESLWRIKGLLGIYQFTDLRTNYLPVKSEIPRALWRPNVQYLSHIWQQGTVRDSLIQFIFLFKSKHFLVVHPFQNQVYHSNLVESLFNLTLFDI
jgi:hypothetical protein